MLWAKVDERLDVDEFQKEMGERKPAVSTSPWKHGEGAAPGEVPVPTGRLQGGPGERPAG